MDRIPGPGRGVGPATGAGLVVAIIVIVYVPRLIVPGSSWARATLPTPFRTIVFVSSAGVALTAVAVHGAVESTVWSQIATAVLVVEGISVALVVSPARERP